MSPRLPHWPRSVAQARAIENQLVPRKKKIRKGKSIMQPPEALNNHPNAEGFRSISPKKKNMKKES